MTESMPSDLKPLSTRITYSTQRSNRKEKTLSTPTGQLTTTRLNRGDRWGERGVYYIDSVWCLPVNSWTNKMGITNQHAHALGARAWRPTCRSLWLLSRSLLLLIRSLFPLPGARAWRIWLRTKRRGLYWEAKWEGYPQCMPKERRGGEGEEEGGSGQERKRDGERERERERERPAKYKASLGYFSEAESGQEWTRTVNID